MRRARQFCDEALSAQALIRLDADQSRHLATVLRLGAGAMVNLFNPRDGEWAGVIALDGRKAVHVRITDQVRSPEVTGGASLLFAPLKRQATDWVVEKATELGAARLIPVLTRRTMAETVRLDRLNAIAREAAAQCGRLDAPEIAAPAPLDHVLDRWPRDQIIAFADEGAAPSWAAARQRAGATAKALLVGPEGGFDESERAFLHRLPFVWAFSFGARILRAETACVAGLALLNAATMEGDQV